MLGRRWLIAGGVLSLGAWQGWRFLDTPLGDNRVAYTPAEQTCTDDPAGFRFCVHRAAQGTDDRLAYLFHGRNLDERTWNDDTYYTSLLQQVWADRGLKPPVVVSVSFGPVWLLTPRGGAAQSGLLETFRDRVMPAVEAQTGTPRERFVFGESMGGVNALAAGLGLPGVFRRVASMCPPLHDISPFASWGELWEVAERTGAEPKRALAMKLIAGQYFADEAEWRAFSPFAIVSGAAPAGAPSIYLSVGLYDSYGGFPGAERFVRSAREHGWQVQWRPLYGGHCAVDVVSVAEFLAAP